jgi:drug/metabolite transporter, DME family
VTSRATAVGSVLAAAVLFGTTGTSQALGPDTTTPLGVGTARLAIGGAALVAVLPLLGGRPRDAVRMWRTPAGLLAGVCTAGYQVAFFAAVASAGVAVGTLVTIGSGPLFAGLLAWAVLGSRPTRGWVAATAACVAGLVLLSSPGLLALTDVAGAAGGSATAGSGDSGSATGGSGGSGPGDEGSGEDGRAPLSVAGGLSLALAAGAAYAGYTVAAKRLLDAGQRAPDVMAAAFGLGGLLLLPLLATQPLGWVATPSGAALALYLGLGTTTLAYLLFGRGLRVLPAGPVTTLVLTEPLVATALGVGLLGERLPAAGVAGVGLLVAGLALQVRLSARR